MSFSRPYLLGITASCALRCGIIRTCRNKLPPIPTQRNISIIRLLSSRPRPGSELRAFHVIQKASRYCRVGSLRCKKEYGANGFQYLIEPTSADELIAFLKQAHHIGNAPEQAPAGSAPVRENQQGHSEEHGSHTLPPAPASSEISQEENHTEQTGAGSGTLRYVQQLEKRLDEKDGEIGFLRSEVAVKNDQIKDLTETCARNQSPHCWPAKDAHAFARPCVGCGQPFQFPGRRSE